MKIKSRLWEHFQIGSMELKNRLAYPPFMSQTMDMDLRVNDRVLNWYGSIAKSGIGLLMVEGAMIEPAEEPTNPALSIEDDSYIFGLTRLAEEIKAHGTKAGIQVVHPGLAAVYFSEGEVVSSSEEPGAPGYIRDQEETIWPRKLSTAEVEEMVDSHAQAAGRAKEAGFDCVELHFAHCMLPHQFLSPYYNHRSDKYGGSFEERLRFPLEIIERTRETVGENYPILVRMSGEELLGEEGLQIGDQIENAQRFEEAGVDCIDVSAGSIVHSPRGITIPLYYPDGCWIPYAEKIKEEVDVPVIGVGGINDMKLAERYVDGGRADLVYMARQLVADPRTPEKWLDGREEDIRKCIGCLEGGGLTETPNPCRPCAVNFDTHRNRFPITPMEDPRRVLVIGGGPGGMEAARISSMRGNETFLFEKEEELGGLVNVASAVTLKSELGNIKRYLKRQVEKLDVNVRLGKEATREVVEEVNPDIVIAATGSRPHIPEKAEGKPVVMSQDEALLNQEEIGEKVLIWGGRLGAETAISLAAEEIEIESGVKRELTKPKTREVTLIGEASSMDFGSALPGVRQLWAIGKLMELMGQGKIELQGETVVKEITGEGAVVQDGEGEESTIQADTVIPIQGRMPKRELIESLRGEVEEFYEIGDCVRPRDIGSAIREANYVTRCML